MPAYVLLSEYTAPLQKVDEARKVHLEWIRALLAQRQLIVAGRRLPPSGGVIVVVADSDEEVEALTASDPYVVRGLARYRRIPFEAMFSLADSDRTKV
ncbi:YciI family protein [Rhodococcus opacus]|nr:YciI family protein [Rhodococcus opacus]